MKKAHVLHPLPLSWRVKTDASRCSLSLVFWSLLRGSLRSPHRTTFSSIYIQKEKLEMWACTLRPLKYSALISSFGRYMLQVEHRRASGSSLFGASRVWLWVFGTWWHPHTRRRNGSDESRAAWGRHMAKAAWSAQVRLTWRLLHIWGGLDDGSTADDALPSVLAFLGICDSPRGDDGFGSTCGGVDCSERSPEFRQIHYCAIGLSWRHGIIGCGSTPKTWSTRPDHYALGWEFLFYIYDCVLSDDVVDVFRLRGSFKWWRWGELSSNLACAL